MINVFQVVSNKDWTGHEQYAFDLASRLSQDPNYYVEIVCKKSEPVINRFRRLEVPVSILPLKGVTDLDSPVRFARLLKRGQNVIHVHSFHDAVSAMVAKRMADNPQVRVVLTLHGVKRRKLNYMTKRVYREMDRIIFVSERSRESTMQKLKLNPPKVQILSDSVLPAHHTVWQMEEMDIRRHYALKPSQVLIMYHGRLNRSRGIDTLLHAVTQLDRSTFFLALVGDGQRKTMTRIKGFVVANNLVRNVALLGYSDNVQALISQCDMGVLPSIVPEAWSLRNMEYMMAGKALITTNNGAQTEYLTNGQNALLVDPDDVGQLASAIQSLIADPALRHNLGQQAYLDFQSKLNYDIFYKRMTGIYQSLF